MEEKSLSEQADEYAESLKKQIENCSKHEAVHILIDQARYWYWSSIDWRESYENVAAKSKKKKRAGKEK